MRAAHLHRAAEILDERAKELRDEGNDLRDRRKARSKSGLTTTTIDRALDGIEADADACVYGSRALRADAGNLEAAERCDA